MQEAQAYRQFEDIERLVESGTDLSVLPLQPLYLAMRSTSHEQAAAILPRLSPEQRQAMQDIDFWQRDEVDPAGANWWLQTVAHCQDDKVRSEFVRSEDFLLAVKCQCEVATFDAEDPHYPDHDNYFMTEDNQLWIAMPEDFAHAQELRQLIRDLYTDMGVDFAYTHLFKMVADSYMMMEEEGHRMKTGRLRDFGFVDHYDALELEAVFASEEAALKWLKGHTSATGDVDAGMVNQSLHASALSPYQGGLEDLRAALEGVTDARRRDFLQFNFVRLVNARLTLEDALKKGGLAMARAGQVARQRLELGFSYAAEVLGSDQVFARLDFLSLHKLGHTLLDVGQRRLKLALRGVRLDEEDAFLGGVWTAFLDAAYDVPVKLKVDGSTPAQEIRSVATWRSWNQSADTLIGALPFVAQMRQTLTTLRDEHMLTDAFYLNYAVADIDFEAIMLSSFVNFTGGHFERAGGPKMGVTVEELRTFYQRFFAQREGEWLVRQDEALREAVTGFLARFGLDRAVGMERWLLQVLVEQLNGYDVMVMSAEDFRHVGGPILLGGGH